MQEHIDIAARDVALRVGAANPPDRYEDDWGEAVINRALASALPWLNTFALEGAAKVGRLEGSIEFKFLNPAEQEARQAALNGRYVELTDRIKGQLPSSADAEPTSGGVHLTAV